MARGSKKQQGFKKSSKPAYKVITNLINNGYIVAIQDAGLNKVKSQSQLNDAVLFYKAQYPSLFKGGKSSPYNQLLAYVKSTGSARGISQKMVELQNAGKLKKCATMFM